MVVSTKLQMARIAGFFVIGSCWTGIGLAQDQNQGPASGPATGGDIIVTATKHGNTSIINTPITIQAISGQALSQRGATEFSDFSKLVAGLSTWDQGPGNKRYVLRGISSGGAGTVGVYLDEVVLTGENSQTGGGLQADPRLYDVQRVEVLKGPQGTTFGSSALSGVIRYILNKPNLEKFSLAGRVAISDQDGAGVGTNFDTTVNVPIVKDVVALRSSAFFQYRPGYISNKYTDDANAEKTWSVREQARVKLGNATLDLMYQHQNTDAGLNYYDLTLENHQPTPTKYYQSSIERQRFYDNLDIFNATLNWDIGFGKITAYATHTDRKIVLDRPGTAVLAAAAKRSLTDPNTLSVLDNPRENKMDSYEARFASSWGGPISLLAGVYYQKDNRVFASRIPTVNPDTGYISPVGGVYGNILQDRSLTTHLREKAAFAEVTWDITDKLQIVGGGRVFKFNNSSQGLVTTGVLGKPGTGYGPVSHNNETGAIGRGIISYNFNPDTKLYAQVAQGYRPGGTNDQAAAALGGATVPSGYKSDSLVNYEVGFKTQSSDRRLFFNLAGFYVDWSNIQLSLKTSPLTSGGTTYAYTGNAGRARIYGLEAEGNYELIHGLNIGFSGSYINATVRQKVTGAGVPGDEIPYSPKWSGTVSADYDWTIGSRKAFVGGDVSYTGTRYTDFPSNTLTYYRLKNYTTVNARAGMDFGNYTVSVIGRNILNNSAVTDVFLEQPPTTLTGYFRNPPRTVSLQFSFNI